MDKPARNLAEDVAGILAILFFTILGYWYYGASGILVGGGLALTVWAASIALFRKG